MPITVIEDGGTVEIVQDDEIVEITSSDFNIEINTTPVIDFDIKITSSDFNIEINTTPVIVNGIPYEGPYEADALFSRQVFMTKDKGMVDNFTVHAINYTEAPNESGVTVTIGG